MEVKCKPVESDFTSKCNLKARRNFADCHLNFLFLKKGSISLIPKQLQSPTQAELKYLLPPPSPSWRKHL